MVVREIVEIDEEKCNGCGECIPNCAEGALKIVEGKARIVDDVYCDGLGACLGYCPQDALKIVKRDAPEFDEEAVHEYLKSLENNQTTIGCVSIQDIPNEHSIAKEKKRQESSLHQWPVQLNLVPVKASHWDNADLLLMADCVAVAYPDLHSELLSGRSVMMGCPKLDNGQHYVDKLAQILKQNDVRSLTMATMEVPCCSGLNRIGELALKASGKMIPSQKLVVSVSGELSRV
jgi:Fe-S-cluster-containing hydrogenase component 2